MADRGSHFTSQEVVEYCKEARIKHQTTSAYAPWMNGLVEGGNHILLGMMKCACAPNLNLDAAAAIDPETILRMWPDHLETIIAQMNDRILPAFRYTPHGIMMGTIAK
ncbi:hypothetical protein FRB94_009447 [Tulasnella sp. JGI-2019a]|nr:hypothetical protein FRB93_008538 [Tulasnella sp. JGI-2019a]KAG8995103.1 hypothetical protein FRB94_009447 [Tulasnella sp. JGI-2019a]